MSASGAAAVLVVLLVASAGLYLAHKWGYMDAFLSKYGQDQSPTKAVPAQASAPEAPAAPEGKSSLTSYPTLFPNPRWNHMPIRFYINASESENVPGFGGKDMEYVRDAAKAWEQRTGGVVSFQEVADPGESELNVTWFQRLDEIRGGKVLGEGGPSRAVETGGTYTLIEGGEIFLIPTDDKCAGTNTAEHELGHVLGLGHIPADPSDVMSARQTVCGVNITRTTVDAIDALYRQPAAADLAVRNVSAVKRGAYLDINFTVENTGILESTDAKMEFVGDNRSIAVAGGPDISDIPPLPPSSGITRIVANLRVPQSLAALELRADYTDSVPELDESNNAATVIFKT